MFANNSFVDPSRESRPRAKPPGPTLPGSSIQSIPGTNVQILLPDGWKIGNASDGLPPGPALKHMTDPKYELQFRQSGPSAAGHSCMSLIGSMGASLGAAGLHPRPSFIPDAYVGTLLEAPKAQLTCLNTGETVLAVLIFLRANPSLQLRYFALPRDFSDADLEESGIERLTEFLSKYSSVKLL
jgi:hypothetical protein